MLFDVELRIWKNYNFVLDRTDRYERQEVWYTNLRLHASEARDMRVLFLYIP